VFDEVAEPVAFPDTVADASDEEMLKLGMIKDKIIST
jgi:hypothetical protein